LSVMPCRWRHGTTLACLSTGVVTTRSSTSCLRRTPTPRSSSRWMSDRAPPGRTPRRRRTPSRGPRGASRRSTVRSRGHRTPPRVLAGSTRGGSPTVGGCSEHCRRPASQTRPSTDQHSGVTSHRQPCQYRGAQGPKRVKGAQSDPNYVSRLLARSE